MVVKQTQSFICKSCKKYSSSTNEAILEAKLCPACRPQKGIIWKLKRLLGWFRW